MEHLNLSSNGNMTSINSEFVLSYEWIIVLHVIYALTTFLSVFGNILVIVVFIRGRKSKTDLRPFLINLAMADLIMAVFCMPFTFAHAIYYPSWVFSIPMCPIVLFMQLLSVASSVFINVAIGVDRFLVVTYPLKSKALQEKAKFVIASIWILSIAVSAVEIPIAYAERDNITGLVKCGEHWGRMDQRIFTVSLFLVTYALPLFILIVAYTVVGYLLWKRTAPGNKDEVRDYLQLRSKVKVVKMLILVVTMFGICWLPLHIFNLVLDFKPDLLKTPRTILLVIYLPCHWLAMANSFANPIIYGFTNESFRADLISLLFQCFPFCRCLRYRNLRHQSILTLDTQVFLRQSSRSSSNRRYSLASQINGYSGYSKYDWKHMQYLQQRQGLLRCSTDKDALSPMTTTQINALRRASAPEAYIQKALASRQFSKPLDVK